MFTQILDLLSGAQARTASAEPDRLQIAVAALLVQAALMNDVFAAPERAAVERLLAERFALSSEAVHHLLAVAERTVEQSSQLYPFTRMAVERLDEAERIRLIEMLWEVAYADGVLLPDEDALVRRIAGLVFVSDHDRGAARKRVLQRLGLQTPT